jgi:hypothetical protein
MLAYQVAVRDLPTPPPITDLFDPTYYAYATTS